MMMEKFVRKNMASLQMYNFISEVVSGVMYHPCQHANLPQLQYNTDMIIMFLQQIRPIINIMKILKLFTGYNNHKSNICVANFLTYINRVIIFRLQETLRYVCVYWVDLYQPLNLMCSVALFGTCSVMFFIVLVLEHGWHPLDVVCCSGKLMKI